MTGLLVAGALLSGVRGRGGAELEVFVWALLFASGLAGLVFLGGGGRSSGEQPW